jgi:GTPase SAR1 family protein
MRDHPAVSTVGGGELCRAVSAACDRFLDASGPPGAESDEGAVVTDALAAVGEVRAGLAEPLRVAVAGRVNAGKSTLVNALLRQRVAPTDVSECTRLVTWYRYGVPERVEVVGHDGGRHTLPLGGDGRLPQNLGVPVAEVSHLDVFVSNDALRDLVLIDTPGLSSTNQEFSQQTRDLLAVDLASRSAVSSADALLFVLTPTLRRDEQDVLEAFCGTYDGFSASALNAVAVLNKADTIVDDPVEMLPEARRLAQTYADALRSSVSRVVPLVSLVAETVDAGLLTERLIDALRQLAQLPPEVLRSLSLSADRFVGMDVAIPSATRAELLERLDLLGIELSTARLRDAAPSSGALLDTLRGLSGIDDLRQLMLGAFRRQSDPLKAASAIGALERTLFLLPESDARRHRLHDDLEELRLDPAMHRLNEFRALQDQAEGRVQLPPELAGDLRRVVLAEHLHERLGQHEGADAATLMSAAGAGASRWKRFGNDARSGPFERRTADALARSYELMWQSVADAAQPGSVPS